MQNENKVIGAILAFVLAIGVMVSIFFMAQKMGYQKAMGQKVDKLVSLNEEIRFKKLDFKPEIDADAITDLLYRIGNKEGTDTYEPFKDQMKLIHHEILDYISESLNLSEIEQERVRDLYDSRSDTLNDSLYQQYLDRNQLVLIEKDKTIVDFSRYQCVENLEEVLSSNICSISGIIISLVISKPGVEKALGYFFS